VPGHRWSAGALPPFSLSAVSAVRTTVKRWRPDVMNVHYLMPTGLAGVVGERLLGVPAVLTLNGRDVPGPGVPPLWRWWQRALLASVSGATYVSGYCRDAVYGAGAGGGEVIYNGVEIPAPAGDGEAVRRRLGIDGDERVVFALQRLAREKRVDVLLLALRRCIDAGGPVRLVIGGTGSEEQRLRALAADLGVDKHVWFTGYIPRAELPGYFAAADIFAFHSTFETFGIAVAQAMSYGLPVVTVRSTALPEIVGDGGVLVDEGDARAFGDAMAALAADEARCRTLGARGRQRAESLFSWEGVAARYTAALERATLAEPSRA
jgi:glycosyltransferase involved in cell wall biosynthesis